MNQQFSFLRMRLQFEAREVVRFPAVTASNAVRGALGWALHADANVYRAIFEPKQESGEGPSGLGDLPRPFVLRASHLNGKTLAPGDTFHLDVHIFDATVVPTGILQQAFEKLAERGFGGAGGRAGANGRAKLTAWQSLDLTGSVNPKPRENMLQLVSNGQPVHHLSVQFVTPTELKVSGALALRPEFPVLFARLRDRLRSLSTLYGTPVELDFEGLTNRSQKIALRPDELSWEKSTRTSRKTGLTHPLGGFLGRVRYEGELDEFFPLLQAACWTGVGRQTVWGKGEMALRILS
jgi:CRISPR-associated endoribonuclease Cas6